MISERQLALRRSPIARSVERLTAGVAMLLPRRLVLWCFIRLVEEVSRGPQYSDSEATRLTVFEAMRRWDGIRR